MERPAVCRIYLQYDRERKKVINRTKKVMENLVGIAISTIKSKSAARHFETMIAAHQFTGSDVGDFGHSRKNFPAILKAANVWFNQQTTNFLRSSLPSTGLPPHFYVTCDKSTPKRLTNQAIVLCPMIAGKREAIVVSSPEVYQPNDSGTDGDVQGASADVLSKALYHEIFKAFTSNPSFVIKDGWMGTVCDGAYQASEFLSTLTALICDGRSSTNMFFNVLWDVPHFVDLACDDIFKGVVGSSKPFVSRLFERSRAIHQLFQRGKLLSHAIQMAKTNDKLVFKVTSGTCSTRFASSQYVEFRKLVDSLP